MCLGLVIAAIAMSLWMFPGMAKAETSFLYQGFKLDIEEIKDPVLDSRQEIKEPFLKDSRNEAKRPVALRKFKEFEPEGLKIDSVSLYPALDMSTQYDTNIYARDSFDEADIVSVMMPSLSFESDLGPHKLAVGMNFGISRYLENAQANYETYSFSGSGLFTLSNTLAVPFEVEWARKAKPRSNVLSATVTEKPLLRTEQSLKAGIEWIPGRFGLKTDLEYIRARQGNQEIFGSEDIFVRKDSDKDLVAVDNTISYKLRPNHTGLLRVRLSHIDHLRGTFDPDTSDFSGPKRDHRRILAGLGMRTQYKGLMGLEFQVGYDQRKFEARSLSDTSGLAFFGNGYWNITRLTSLSADVSRTTSENPETNSSLVKTLGRFTLDHELRRNAVLSAFIEAATNEFETTGREDDEYGAGLGLRYKLSPHFHLNLDYVYQNRSSTDSRLDYERNLFMIRLKSQY